jgi:hypothetical protein
MGEQVILHAVKSYDMGPSRFIFPREERVLRIFIALIKSIALAGVRTRNLWVQWQAH